MSESPASADAAVTAHSRRWLSRGSILRLAVGMLLAWAVIAYVVLPLGWRFATRHHPALTDAPRRTHTASGIPGDPVNIGLIGSEEDLHRACLAAGWFPADPLTLKSSLRIAADTVLRREYTDAPVSNLFLWDRKEDFAFEQPFGADPRRRHHVRFWRSPTVDVAGRQAWFGAATFDQRVGLSHTTGEITHHIAPDVDAERDKLLKDLQTAGALADTFWVDGYQSELSGRNGGGDPWRTDGRLGVGVLRMPAGSQSVSASAPAQATEAVPDRTSE